VTILLAAALVEGVVVEGEPVVSGVECEASIVEGAELEAEVMAD
jgi:hypothetical protein